MAATNEQVQAFVDSRIRPIAERIRAVVLEVEDVKAAIDDVYANLSNSPTWTDDREDAPPYLLTPSNVLSINTVITALLEQVRDHGEYPVLLKACVNPVRVS